MAKCEKGYLCVVCGSEVEHLRESELYLRYVIGWLDPEKLHIAPERHLTCNPNLAQFIDDPRFSKVTVEGSADRRLLDTDFSQQRAQLVTRGWQRLVELEETTSPPPVTEYPLHDVIERYRTPNVNPTAPTMNSSSK